MTSSTSPLRLLHTSDWHIGKRLYHQNRHEEFVRFLSWLYDAICTHRVDILVVAGDIFDTTTPNNQSQTLYYDFLAKVAKSPCQHVIIIAGNHDSPALLDAPKHLLKSLNVHVIGVISNDPHDDCLILSDDQDNPQAIIMGVPYLRDKDIKVSTNLSDYDTSSLTAIHHHYQTLAQIAKDTQQQLMTTTGKKIPIIATGHLFCGGASVSAKDDGMRQLYVGTLQQIPASIFDSQIDYVALGHIHAPQAVGGHQHIRYCGSPLMLGFGEIGKPKQVLMVDFDDELCIQALPVPTFQRLHHIQGDLTHIHAQLDNLINQNVSIWVQIIYTGDELHPQLATDLNAYLEGSQVLALNIQNKTLYQNSLYTPQREQLGELSPMQVFAHRLAKEQLTDGEINDLTIAYQYVLTHLDDSELPPSP